MRTVFTLALGVVMTATSLHGQSSPAGTPKISQRAALPSVLPGTRVDAFSTINGNALDSEDVTLATSLVRLRSARIGQVVDTQVTDKSGKFSFFRVDPGYYVVELFDRERRTLATSPIVITGPGSTATTSVKLPPKGSMLTSLLILGLGGANPGENPAVSQVPPAVLKTIPAVVPAGDPASER